MKEISITDIKNIRIGQMENKEAGTGCTVIVSENETPAGIDIRGGAATTRDTALLDPLAARTGINGVVLAGGSAFGHSATDGVLQYLEEHKIGFDVTVTTVPLVCSAAIFDLTVGRADVRPDKNMGYEACKHAFESPNYRDGNFGAGCGASVGKMCGMDYCMKSGIGSYAIESGELQIGAIVSVNALGDIYDKNGQKIAGLLGTDKKSFRDSSEEMYKSNDVSGDVFTPNNTTIGIIITNAKFEKTKLCKIASMTHDGYARAIKPLHTTADGDTIFALSVGNVDRDMDVVGTLAAEVMHEAIIRAVKAADSAYGLPSAKDI